MVTADIDTPDTRRAIHHIEVRVAEQVAHALRQLEANGDVTDEQRAAVEALGERLADRLVAPPRRSLREADRRNDATAATAIALFSRGSGR